MRKSKTEGVEGALNPSHTAELQIIDLVSQEEISHCQKTIGYCGWDNSCNTEMTIDGDIIVIGCGKGLEDTLTATGLSGRVEMRSITVGQLSDGISKDKTYRLACSSRRMFGDLTLPEVIKYFGDKIDPDYMAPGSIRLKERDTVEYPRDEIQFQMLGPFPSDE